MHSLTKRLAAICLALSLALLSSWVFWCVSNTQETLLNQKKQDFEMLLSRTADYVQLYSQGLNTSLLSFCSTLEVMEDDGEQIQAALNGFQRSNPGKVYSIACVLEDGRAYCNRAVALEVFGNAYFDNFYEDAHRSSYKGIRWSEPYISPLTLERTMALYKPVTINSGLGTVIMEVNLSTMLSSILRATNDSSLTWAVVSGAGALVATSDDYTTVSSNYKQIPRALLEEEMEKIITLPAGTRECRLNDTEYLIFRQNAVCMDWSLMALSQTQTVYDAVSPLLMRTLGMGVLHLMLLTVLLSLAGGRYARLTARISNEIKTAKSPLHLSFPETARRKDELGDLSRSIEGMIARIQRLNDEREDILNQQRQLEIDVLQGQIHPHFLGNTLACIQSLVKDGRREDALNALTSLVKLLNYSIARTDSTVNLGDELECAKAYVALRRMRAAYAFSYQVYVLNAHMAQPVPRLILQPIIENAIVHGFAGLDRAGSITVTSYIKDGKLLLSIDDDGLGADERRLEDVAAGVIAPSEHAHGIGVGNVFKRLRLNDATPNGCRLLKNQSGGVRVVLDLGRFIGTES